MTKFEIKQLRKKGKFVGRADVILYDRRAPNGEVYCGGVTMEHARKIVANEVKAFQDCGLAVSVI